MVGGIRNIQMLSALAALSLSAGPNVLAEPVQRSRMDPESERRGEQRRRQREQRQHAERAYERKQRRRSDDEMRERMLRERIAKGQDDRPDKYLHASARRRRQAEAAAREEV